MLEPMQYVDETAASFATKTDFCKVFTEEMDSLYLLSLLLTADHEKAHQCFVSAMGECVEAIDVFTEWAHSWARRTVLKNATQMIMPAPEHGDSSSLISFKGAAISGKDKLFTAVLALGAFERFVFVMSILEGQSDEDCTLLLRCSRRDVMIARALALTRLAHSDGAYRKVDEIPEA
jgi:hypothetical protein